MLFRSVPSHDNTTEEYKLVDNIIDIDNESQIFLIQEIADEKYELFFGDGIFGKKLENYNEITATYIVTNGKAGNGASSFTFSGTILSSNNDNLSRYASTVITNQAASNGDEIQTIDSVRYYAPRLYASQYRAVTANDYEAVLASIYPNKVS